MDGPQAPDGQLVLRHDLFDGVGGWHGARPVVEGVLDVVEIGQAQRGGGEAGVLAQLRPADREHVEVERLVLRRVPADHHHLAVGGGEHRVVHRPEAADLPLRHGVVPQVVVGVLVDVQHRLGHRDVDAVTAAGALPLVQRSEDGGAALQRRVDVGVAVRVVGVLAARRGLGAGVALAGVALGLGEAALRAHHRRVRATVHPRTGLAVAADAGEDQPRVAGPQDVPAEAQAVHHAGAEVLHHHVGNLHQPQHQVAPLLRVEVDADAALPGVLLGEVRRDAVDPRPGGAGDVALRRFQLDDLGSKIQQHSCRVRAGEYPGEVEDANSGERAVGHAHATLLSPPTRRRRGASRWPCR